MPDTQLEFATTEELLAELAKRHEALIVAGKPLAAQGYYTIRSGNPLLLRGLLSVARDDVIASVRYHESQNQGPKPFGSES